MRALSKKIQNLILPVFSIIYLGISIKTNAFDARPTFPMPQLLAPSWKDGFFLENATVPNYGFHVHASGVYNFQPFGDSQSPTDSSHRFFLQLNAMASINKYFDIRLAFPILLYETGPGLGISYGDLRIGGKLNIGEIISGIAKKKIPLGIAIAGDVGISVVSNQDSFFNAGPKSTTSGDIKLIVESPHLLDNRFFITANIGGLFGGSVRNLDGTGLGNHFIWGAGLTFQVLKGFGLRTELSGTVVLTEASLTSPVIWDVGILGGSANSVYWYAFFAAGLTDNAPKYSVGIAIGFSLEVVKKPEQVSKVIPDGKGGVILQKIDKPEPEPEKKPPAAAPAAPGATPAGGPKSPDGSPSGAAAPPPGTPPAAGASPAQGIAPTTDAGHTPTAAGKKGRHKPHNSNATGDDWIYRNKSTDS